MEQVKTHDAARREFLKRVGRTAVAAPAAALLLSVAAKPASAGSGQYGGGSCSHGSHGSHRSGGGGSNF